MNIIPIESGQPAWRPPQWQRPERSAQDLADDYVFWGRAHGGPEHTGWSDGHAVNITRHLQFWCDCLALRTAADLRGALFEAERALARRKAPPMGKNRTMSLDLWSNDPSEHPNMRALGGSALRGYAVTLKSWCAWLVERGALDANPVEKLTLMRGRAKSRRRAFTLDEIPRLLRAAEQRRRILYELALVTGLRANELRSLRSSDLDFAAGGARLSPQWTKNRQECFQPLPARTLQTLRTYGLPAVPQQPARTLKSDCDRAGIEWRDTGAGKLDFHALRVTFSTLLDHAQASEKENQTLMRHASRSITYGVYTKAQSSRLAELVERIALGVVPAREEKLLWE